MAGAVLFRARLGSEVWRADAISRFPATKLIQRTVTVPFRFVPAFHLIGGLSIIGVGGPMRVPLADIYIRHGPVTCD